MRKLSLGLLVVILAGASPLAAEEAKIIKDDWNWAKVMLEVARKGKGKNKQGVVLTLGDSLSFANQSTRWAKYGKGKTNEDKAILRWSHAGKDNKRSGWWLAAVDRPGGRSETAASGVRTDQYLRISPALLAGRAKAQGSQERGHR
jgi:hypothetical protein